MSLMLSHHGVWFYRKVNVLPCGKRREFRRSLGTRSKTEATKRSLRFADRPWLIIETVSPTISMSQTPQSELSFQELKLLAVQYVEFKSLEVWEKVTGRDLKKCMELKQVYLQYKDTIGLRLQINRIDSGLNIRVADLDYDWLQERGSMCQPTYMELDRSQ